MPTTHIVFVGRDKKRLTKSVSQLREVGFSRIVLVVGDNPRLPGEKVILRLAEELETELGAYWNVSLAYVSKNSVLDAANQILTLVNTEKSMGNDVLLNASHALRALSISAYIAACMSRTKIVCALPNKKRVRDFELVEVPVLPIDYPGHEQKQLILHIGEGVESLDTLIFMLFPDIDKDAPRFKSERSRLSHHLTKLEEDGFIKKTKNGRNISIRLTCMGKMLAQNISIEKEAAKVHLDESEAESAGSLAS